MDGSIHGVIYQVNRYLSQIKNFVSLTPDTVDVDKSEIITNILLGIPIPPIYIIDDRNSKYTSINDTLGNLICNAIDEFLDGKFEISCDLLNISGYYDKIPNRYINVLKDSPIIVISIYYDANPEIIKRIENQIKIK